MSMKKILAGVVCIVMLCTMTSCMSYYEEEEIGAALAELIPASLPLNEIYFGEGLPFAEEDEEVKRFFDAFNLEENASSYYPVSETCGYANIEEIKEATRAVYSDAYCEYLFTMAFSGISDTFNEGTAAEVSQTAVYARYIEHSGILTRRHLEEDDIIPLNRTYDVSNFTVMINREEYVTAEVQSYVNGQKDALIEVKLVLTPNGWRLDSPTY